MADIQFNFLPSNIRVPGVYAETNNSQANTSPPGNLRALLIGQITASGVATPSVPVISTGNDGKAAGGPGSVLAQMAHAYRKNDTFGELWYLPLADAGGGTAATGTVAFAGPATAAGTLSLYIGGFLVSVPVTSGMTAAQLATAVAAAITANPDLAVTASATTSTVTLTAKNKGLVGNDIDIRVNYRGTASGEALPAGITPTITAMASGATNPSLTAGLAALGDAPFEFIVCSLTDSASIAAITAFLADNGGRWSPVEDLFGHAFIAYRGTYGALTTFGVTMNDQHTSDIGFNDSPTPTWKWAAALGAQSAVSVRADAAQPIREVVLQDVLAPPIQSRFSLSQRNSLLYDGVSTFKVDPSGNVILEKLITTYQLNSLSQPDNSYLDAETMFNIAFVLRNIAQMVSSKYGRTKLAADNSRLAPGSGVATPSMVRGDLIAQYLSLQSQGFVQASDEFSAGLVVQINSGNPNRLDCLWPGILIQRLDVFALLNQFRLAA